MNRQIRRVAGGLVLALCATVGLRGQSTPPSILLVQNPVAPNPFGGYLAEILRAEGVMDFAVADLADVDAADLTAARLVVLAETPLTSGEAALFADYVAGGGRLIAMRPDAQLAPVLGLTPAGGATADGYVLIDQAGPGAGLQAMTLPFRGEADHYTLNGATAVAALYTTRTTAAGFPAVVRYNQTAAWTFDLARSTAYTRQGDPALAGVERDGEALIRTTDVFYGNVDLQRAGVPHADVQMRLLSRTIASLLSDLQPTPRLWYFPGTARTLLVLTGDSHTSVVSSYDALLAAVESYGGRLSIFLSRFISLPSANVTAWRGTGHELGLHPYFTPDGLTIPDGYAANEASFLQDVGPIYGPTVRHHSVEWAGWIDPIPTMTGYGIRMDLSYYSWGPVMYAPDVHTQAHGYVTGSGLPMRFVDAAGAVAPVYQQATALIDEQLVTGPNSELLDTPSALAVSQQLIDNSRNGGYSAIATQFHVDYYEYGEVGPWVDGTLEYAQSLNVPMWTAERWLRYVEARAATQVTDVAWNAGSAQLALAVAVPAGAEAQSLLVPRTYGGQVLSAVTVDGQHVVFSPLTVNGQAMRAFSVSPIGNGDPRTVHATYGPLPVVSIADASVTEGDTGTTAATLAVTLSAPSLDPVTVNWATADASATAGSDYIAASGVLTIPAGATAVSVPIAVLGDVLDEPDEAVTVTLSTPTNATLADAAATLTITDDDPLPLLAIAGAAVTEGDTGSVVAEFTVTLTPASGRVVTVSYATVSGTATSGQDFTAASGTLTFPAGATTATVSVGVTGDIQFEADEVFAVGLSGPTNATVDVASAAGTILNDDALPVAAADAYATPFETTLVIAAPGVLGNDSNDGGGTMTASLVTTTVHGTLSLLPAGGFTYVPAAGYYGVDGFAYRVSDGSGDGNAAAVTIAVGTPAPVASPDAFTTGFETPLRVAAPGVLANDVTYGAAVTTVTVVSTPAHGTLALDAATGGFAYVPATDFVGADVFTYRIGTAAGQSPPASVALTVSAPTMVQAPRNLRVVAVEGSVVTIRWTAAPVGPAPTSYVLEGGVLPGQTLAAVPIADAIPAMTLQLPAGVFYIRARAVSAGETSAATADIRVTTGQSIAPATPFGLLASVAGAAVSLEWTTDFSAGVPAAHVLAVTGSATAEIPLSAADRASFAAVPGGTYGLRVRATNAAGASSLSAPVTVTVPDTCTGAPEMPRDLLTFAAGGVATALWDMPDAGSAPTAYVVEVEGLGGYATTRRQISGHVPAGTYRIAVRAVNACGSSVTTAPSVLAVP